MNKEKAIKEMCMGKLYYKNGDNYIEASDIIFNHPLIQDLLKNSNKLDQIQSASLSNMEEELETLRRLIYDIPLDSINIEELRVKASTIIKNTKNSLQKYKGLEDKDKPMEVIKYKTIGCNIGQYYVKCPNCHDEWKAYSGRTKDFKFCPECGLKLEYPKE